MSLVQYIRSLEIIGEIVQRDPEKDELQDLFEERYNVGSALFNLVEGFKVLTKNGRRYKILLFSKKEQECLIFDECGPFLENLENFITVEFSWKDVEMALSDKQHKHIIYFFLNALLSGSAYIEQIFD